MFHLLMIFLIGNVQSQDLVSYAFSDENYDLAFEIPTWKCWAKGESDAIITVKGRPLEFVRKLVKQRCIDQGQASCAVSACRRVR